jgi:hypothetical protein
MKLSNKQRLDLLELVNIEIECTQDNIYDAIANNHPKEAEMLKEGLAEVMEMYEIIEESGTLKEYLNESVGEEVDFIIADCDMPATFVWEGGKVEDYFTEAGYEKFKQLLDSQVSRHHTDDTIVEVHCDNEELGRLFVWANAGYVAKTLFNEWFKQDE